MNDRGLSLSPTDMLKGYLLANIDRPAKRTTANDLWRDADRAPRPMPARKPTRLLQDLAAQPVRRRRSANARRGPGPRTSTASAPSSIAGFASDASDDRPEGQRRLLPVHRPRLRLLQPPVPAADGGLARHSVPGPGACPATTPHHGFTLQYHAAARPADAGRRRGGRPASCGSSPGSSTSCSPGGSGTSAASPTPRCSTPCSS